MVKEIAHDAIGQLIPESGQRVAEDAPERFVALVTKSDTRSRGRS